MTLPRHSTDDTIGDFFPVRPVRIVRDNGCPNTTFGDVGENLVLFVLSDEPLPDRSALFAAGIRAPGIAGPPSTAERGEKGVHHLRLRSLPTGTEESPVRESRSHEPCCLHRPGYLGRARFP